MEDYWEEESSDYERAGYVEFEEPEYMDAYVEDVYEDEEPEAFRDDEEDEFAAFEERDPEEMTFSYAQLGHVNFGDLETGGTTIGGRTSKTAQILRSETVAKEKLYLAKLVAVMNERIFPESEDLAGDYVNLIKKIPRYWLKNIDGLSAAILLFQRFKGKPITSSSLVNTAAKYIPASAEEKIKAQADLLRYYRLVSKYF